MTITPSQEVTRTVTTRTPRKLNATLRRRVDQLSQTHVALRDIIEHAVLSFDQPLSVAEVTAYVNDQLGEKYDKSTIRISLKELVSSGRLIGRVETMDERAIRANGQAMTSRPATLYFDGRADEVPARTVSEAVPGVTLQGPGRRGSGSLRKPNVRQARSKVAGKPGRVTKTQARETVEPTGADTGAIDFLIEKLVAARTQELQAELSEARARLAELEGAAGKLEALRGLLS